MNLSFDKEKGEFTFRLSSYTVPPVTCRLNLLNYTFKYVGKTEVSFDASQLTTGMYIYRIQSGDFKSTKKMMLVK